MKNFCEICGSKKLYKVLDLGKHPLCDDLKKIGSKKKNKSYKIVILLCKKCLTAHQKFQVKKEILFPRNYHYRARFTKDVLSGMKDLVRFSENNLGSLKKKIILDVGCNDGSLLNFFYEKGCKTIGIEPTRASKDISKKKHLIYNDYFSLQTAEKIKKKYKHIDLITFTNVFAHMENIKYVFRVLKKIISDKTFLIIENHYLGSVLKKNQFDTFYHEHPRTYSIKSFFFIAKKLNLNILAIQFPKRYGGNIRVLLGHRGIKNKNNFKDRVKQEKKFLQKFTETKKIINKWKIKKNNELNKLFIKHGKIPAKAFPGRAAILIKLLGLDEKIISKVYEKPKSLKIGHYVPGTRIPIYSDTSLFKNIKKNKIILNFAWHIKKEIKAYLRKNKFKGKIINILNKD